jgi:hypothetical protein
MRDRYYHDKFYSIKEHKPIIHLIMKKNPLRYCLLLILLFIYARNFAQITISGPTCVVRGTIYQYKIQGGWDSLSTMQVCINGGLITEKKSSSSCTIMGKVLGAVSVVWSSDTIGSVNVTSSKGNAILNVSITSLLNGGTISMDLKSQSINFGLLPTTISCSVPTGGACTPNYLYQWQASSNAVDWTDLANNNGENLSFTIPLKETKYYRRRTKETVSGNIAFSDVAMVATIITSPDQK